MIGTLDLFKLKLSPDNTMFFSSVEEQTEWFNERVGLSIENVSFNGSRPFRLSSNYLEATFEYNYCRYKFGNRYVFAFIENMTYLNDNTCELNVSIDMTQTFLAELKTAIAKSNIQNTTEKDEYFNVFRPFTNKLTPSDFNVTKLGELNNNTYDNEIGGFMLINVDPNLVFNSPAVYLSHALTDNGLPTNVMCIALPLTYNLETRQLHCPQAVYYGNENKIISGAGNLFQFLSQYASYIADGSIGITFDGLSVLKFIGDNTVFGSTNNLLFTKFPEDKSIYDWCIILNNNEKETFTFDLTQYLQNIPVPLRRNPYVYIRVGNDSESIELNLLDFYSDNPVEETMQLEIEKFTSCVFPFTTSLKFKYNGREITDRNAMFNLITSDPVPYTISAWQEYYSNNKASVNDGLATQQKYQSAQLRNNLGTSLVNTGIDTAMGGISWTKSKGQFGAKSWSTQQQFAQGGVGLVQGVLGAVTTYANGKLEMAKDKALQQIGWNDIKSSPSSFANMCSSLTAKYNNGHQGIEVDIYIAKNIEDIKAYHLQFGYVVNRMESNPFTNFQKHENFDYISFNEVTLAMELPQYIVSVLEEILESGIRFWYNYDNFLNYNLPNLEVSNGEQATS